jgi:hypothetical protein
MGLLNSKEQMSLRRVAVDAFLTGLASHATYPSLTIDLPASET